MAGQEKEYLIPLSIFAGIHESAGLRLATPSSRAGISASPRLALIGSTWLVWNRLSSYHDRIRSGSHAANFT